MFKGKRTCKILKEIRRQIAAENDIEYVTSECKHQGDCAGTCPKCEAEVRYLEKELEKRVRLGKAVTVAGLAATITATTLFGTACRSLIPQTERTEEFLAVQLPYTPADFIEKSDRNIYTTLKTALAEAQCLEEDERYVFLAHWNDKFYSTYHTEESVKDTYRISVHTDIEQGIVQEEFLYLTFSAAGVLLTATYEVDEYFYGTGGDPGIWTLTDPNGAQAFSDPQELLEEMNLYISHSGHADEIDRKLIRALWNEYYAHTRGDVDYYTISEGRIYTEYVGYTTEELTRPRYLALTFAEDGTLTGAKVRKTP